MKAKTIKEIAVEIAEMLAEECSSNGDVCRVMAMLVFSISETSGSTIEEVIGTTMGYATSIMMADRKECK